MATQPFAQVATAPVVDGSVAASGSAAEAGAGADALSGAEHNNAQAGAADADAQGGPTTVKEAVELEKRVDAQAGRLPSNEGGSGSGDNSSTDEEKERKRRFSAHSSAAASSAAGGKQFSEKSTAGVSAAKNQDDIDASSGEGEEREKTGDSSSEGGEGGNSNVPNKASFNDLFIRFASTPELLLNALGLVMAVAAGVAQPLMTIVGTLPYHVHPS